MRVTVTFYFSFPNNRIRISGGTNIKCISFESSPNTKQEEYTFIEEYHLKKEGFFRKRVKERLQGHIRRSPSITSCVFKCDLVPTQVTLNEEFNRKLTEVLIRKLAVEISLKARRRYKNPKAFM